MIEPAPDSAIWNAVFVLVAKPTTTPTNSFKLESNTPLKSTTSSQQGSEQTHAEIDYRILQEVDLCLYENTKGFYEKYFEGRPWTATVARFAQNANPQICNGRWTDYPYPPTQAAFFKWFWKLLPTFPVERRSTYYTSFNKPLEGFGGNRQPDLFLAPLNIEKCNERYHWRDVQVIGELKESVSKNSLQEIAQFCGYAREVFTNQPTRLFLHGFVLRGSIMELWVCDRSGPYSCERFDVHKDPVRFIKVIVAYTMMSDDDLGLNTFIKGDKKFGRWIMFKGDGNTKQERLELEDQPIAFQRAIVCRGTTCYRAKRHGASRWDFVIKFSWRSNKRRAEGDLLQLAQRRNVWGVAKLFGHQDLISVSQLRKGLQFGMPRSFPSVSSGSINQTQSKSKSKPYKSNKSQSPCIVTSTTTLPSSSSLGRKRKFDTESAAPLQPNNLRSSGVRRQSDIAAKAASHQDNSAHTAKKAKSTSLMPSKDDATFDDRILCCLIVSPPGRAINQFESIGEYLKACRDAIKGHQSLYEAARILHRDVSQNNIIITDAKNDTDPKGMLIDLDLAKELNCGSSGARHRTGTMQFMAIDVLEGHTHTYRHDLESFFYVFLWIIIRHDPKGGERDLSKESRLRAWYTGSYEQIADAKMCHMLKDRFKLILDEFPRKFDDLKELAEELRMVLFPLRDGTVFRGTLRDHKKLYIPIVAAFNKAIFKLNGKT